MTPMMMRFMVLAAAMAAASMQLKARAETAPAPGYRSCCASGITYTMLRPCPSTGSTTAS